MKNKQLFLRRSGEIGIINCCSYTIGSDMPQAGAGPDRGRMDIYMDEKNSGLLLLANYRHSVSAEYEPEDLKHPCGGQQRMRAAAAAALEEMVAGLKDAGFDIILDSGYRPYSRQHYLFTTRIQREQDAGMSYEEAYDAVKLFTAVPGTSEHQLGLAMDLSVDGDLNAEFAFTEQGKWLAANCDQYGYILRYVQEKYDCTRIGDEPWHFRYVGAPHAQIMKENNLCLEEYLDYLKDVGHIVKKTGGAVYEIYWIESGAAAAEFENVIDQSSDNCGGTVVTTCRKKV